MRNKEITKDAARHGAAPENAAEAARMLQGTLNLFVALDDVLDGCFFGE